MRIFHREEVPIEAVKKHLHKQGIEIRSNSLNLYIAIPFHFAIPERISCSKTSYIIYRTFIMILAVDVHYQKEAAIVGGVLFRGWHDAKPLKELVISCSITDNYIPGQFYRRELPCIAALLQQVSESLECIVIDGFVYLGRTREPGLGKHLRDMLDQKVVVIGVAKTPFRDTPKSCEVLRGNSRNPLYVTADGMKEDRARFLIKNMHGKNRVPTLLKYVDRLCKADVSHY